MRITEIKTFLMQAGSPHETGWGRDERNGGLSAVGARNWLFVKIYTDAGFVGIGECSGWPRVVQTAVHDLATHLVGEDPRHIERLWQTMQLAMMGHGITGVVGAGAMTGIDMALWDLKGKVLGVPVWDLLGGRIRDRVRAYSHVSTPETAKELLARGFTAVKTTGVADTLKKVERIRSAVGDAMDIMLDLHGPPWMTVKDAILLGKTLEPSRLLFLEEPVPPEDIEGLAEVARRVDIPIAAGERLGNLWMQTPLLTRRIVDVLQPDTGRVGGITQLRKIAAAAEAHFVQIAPHAGTLGPVAEYAAVHLMASIPNALILERFEDDWPGKLSAIDHPLICRDGFLEVPERPGLGVDVDEGFVARHPSLRNTAIPIKAGSGAYAPGTEAERSYTQTRFGRANVFGRAP
jgi:galactonate dehydratase